MGHVLLKIWGTILGLGSLSGLLSLAWQIGVRLGRKPQLRVSQKGDSKRDRLYLPVGGPCVGLRVINDGEVPVTIIGCRVAGPRLKRWGRRARFGPVLEDDDGAFKVPGTPFVYGRDDVLNGRVDEDGCLETHGATITRHLVCETQDLLPPDLPQEIRVKVTIYDHKGKAHKAAATVRVDRSGLRTQEGGSK